MPRSRQCPGAIVKGLPMTLNNRSRKSPGNVNNLPGLGHVNAFPISDNSDVGEVNRTRKSSGSESTSSGGSSGTAYQWLLQSSWGSFASGLLDARQPAPEPLCDAPLVRRSSSSQVPINGSETRPELLQSSVLVHWPVRRMPPVGSSVCVNRSAESDVLREVLKSSESLHSESKKCAYA